jgi:molybdopterin molybdotransferase
MISLNDALVLIQKLAINENKTKTQISNALGSVLCEDIYSGNNTPPFDKSAMDGYACRKSDIDKNLKVIESIPAGYYSDIKISVGTCAKIMTGARVPEGADCVIKIEDTEIIAPNKIRYKGQKSKSNICYLGEDIKAGQKILSRGDIIYPSTIAVLASEGKTEIEVYKRPDIALIATGDELVEPNITPSEVQIRNSNSYNLTGQINSLHLKADYFGIVNDTICNIKESIKKAFEKHDILILTGGVSVGDKDFVPGILADEGYTIHFNKLAIQPGKPIVFASNKNKFCFGLSGNPVSSMLQFELLVKPFIYFYMHNNYKLPFIKTLLINGISRRKTERQQFFPVKIVDGKAEAIEFHGSAHILSIHHAVGFGFFPVGVSELKDNTIVDILLVK